jgi:hypothetical protein
VITDEEDGSNQQQQAYSSSTSGKNKKSFDLTYYRSVMLLALSRIRFDYIDLNSKGTISVEPVTPSSSLSSSKGESASSGMIASSSCVYAYFSRFLCCLFHCYVFLSLPIFLVRFSSCFLFSSLHTAVHPIFSIVTFAKSVIEDNFTKAKAISRLLYRYSDANLLPSLAYEGIDVAAALTCLAEMDIQTAFCLSRNQGKGDSASKLLDLIAPTQASILSKTAFHSFFLPPGSNLVCLYHSSSSSSSSGSSR